MDTCRESLSTDCMGRKVLMADVSGKQVHGRRRLVWMDGRKAAFDS